MPGRHLNCYCGNCPACIRLMEYRAARESSAGCRCGMAKCDCARWDTTFETNHGHEVRDYYSSSTIRSAGSSLGGIMGLDFRGTGLGDGVATFPASHRWRATMRAEARAAVEQRELRRAG